MSKGNGDKIELIKVSIAGGNMVVDFGKHNIALLSHALRVAGLHLDDMIVEKEIVAEESEKPKIVIPPNILDKLRGR